MTNNASEGQVNVDLQATYTATPAFTNPADSTGRRLIDGDRPHSDWNTTTGIHTPQQTVTFDLRTTCVIDELEMHFDQSAKPASVSVSVADDPAGPWRQMGVIRLNDQPHARWRLPMHGSRARFVRMDHVIHSWGWYLRDVRLTGRPATDKVQPTHREGDQLVLVDQRGIYASIVVGDEAAFGALQAAALFQQLAQRMTGRWLPIERECEYDGSAAAVLIGDSRLARQVGVDVEQNPTGDDRYVIRGGSDYLALVGNDAVYHPRRHLRFRGSLYAVYDFFGRQGFGWYGSDDLWKVVPHSDRLAAEPIDVVEVPAFRFRDIWMAGMHDQNLRDAWRLGGVRFNLYHNYDHLVPPESFRVHHPEWFGPSQPDITHPQVIRIATEQLARELDADPDAAFLVLSASANDSEGYVSSPYRPVGNISAQQMYFANQVAIGLRRSHPERRFAIGFLAYWHSHSPPVPPTKAEPEVNVMIVNEGNHAKPLDLVESERIASTTARNNTREQRDFAGWRDTGGLTGVYEWWIPALGDKVWESVPWYDGDTTLRNQRWWRERGVRYLTYESQGEINGGIPLRWAQYYIGARGMWDTTINPDDELRKACDQLFGEAGRAIQEYYLLQQQAMRDCDQHVGNWSLPAPQILYTPKIESRGDEILARAMAHATDPLSRQRVAVEQAQWNALKRLNSLARTQTTKTYTVVLDGANMDWPRQMIDAASVRSLFGLSPDHALEVLETDGQNRPAMPGETYNIEAGVTFRTRPAQAP